MLSMAAWPAEMASMAGLGLIILSDVHWSAFRSS